MSASDSISTNERSSFANPHPLCMSGLDISRVRLHAQRIEDPHSPTPETVVSHLGAVQARDYHGALWSIALRQICGTGAEPHARSPWQSKPRRSFD